MSSGLGATIRLEKKLSDEICSKPEISFDKIDFLNGVVAFPSVYGLLNCQMLVSTKYATKILNLEEIDTPEVSQI